ncbi:MAG: 1,4-dihydroxy-2-naphthoate octaprenyltransferase [Deltaproteobacteria bacterium]|nr:1,4-dihydroxy-2-naphthoate octaprenyltransferase [Deltaproteobacteria bacterium]
MNAIIRALRVPFLAGSIVPVIIGAAFAFLEKSFDVVFFLVSVLGVAALHTGANLINDYYDARGSDSLNVRLNPFSGGSRVIPDRELGPGTMMVMALFFFALSLACGIWLVFAGRPLVAVIGLLGLAIAWAYSSPPLQLMSRGWGEIAIFFAFGPLVTLGTAYVMTDRMSWPAFTAGIPQGFFIAAVIWINQFPDYDADRAANKRNLVVKLGPERARYVYAFVMLAAFFSVLYLVGAVGLHYLIMLSFVSTPLGLKAIWIFWKNYDSHEGIIPAQALTIQTLIAHGVLVSVGLVLGRFI